MEKRVMIGELLTVLAKEQRDQAILLPYSKKPFRVPDNVFIIGTMQNGGTLHDPTLRRRFGFIELRPDPELLKEACVGGIALGNWLDTLNQHIRKLPGWNAHPLQIGHGYLMERGQPISDFAAFARIVHEEILPLLEEYCNGDYDKLERVMGKTLIDAKARMIRHALFDGGERGMLVPALLVPWPEIAISNHAIAAEAQAAE